jgi:hypothetical protein
LCVCVRVCRACVCVCVCARVCVCVCVCVARDIQPVQCITMAAVGVRCRATASHTRHLHSPSERCDAWAAVPRVHRLDRQRIEEEGCCYHHHPAKRRFKRRRARVLNLLLCCRLVAHVASYCRKQPRHQPPSHGSSGDHPAYELTSLCKRLDERCLVQHGGGHSRNCSNNLRKLRVRVSTGQMASARSCGGEGIAQLCCLCVLSCTCGSTIVTRGATHNSLSPATSVSAIAFACRCRRRRCRSCCCRRHGRDNRRSSRGVLGSSRSGGAP